MSEVPLSNRPTQATVLLHTPAGTLLLPAAVLLLLLLLAGQFSWMASMGTAQ
jgi:hypothetical protein